MTLLDLANLQVYNKTEQEWKTITIPTDAAAVRTKNSSNVQAELDGIPGQISGAVDTAISDLKGGVDAAGDTLAKLYAILTTIQELITSDDLTLDTVQEIVNLIKSNKSILDHLGTSKLNITDVVNNLETTAAVEGKALDARQGKVLKDAIDELKEELETLIQQGGGSTAPLTLTDTPPESPVDGQIWFKRAGTIQLED